MLIHLGENIKRLRTAKGLTQEQFGYELGISAQAISRWENGITYPDITALPVIADFFDVTLDELMGREQALAGREREAFFKRMSELRHRGELAGVLEAYDKILLRYPNDAYLFHGKANTLYYSLFNKSGDLTVAQEIIALCNKINRSNNPDMQCGANALLVRVYARIGHLEEARKLANALPSFEVGRELLILECLQGAEKKEHYQYLIQRFSGKIAGYQKRLDALSRR